MEKTIKTFKQFSEKGYKHYTENTIKELDKLPLDSSDIITEFAHLCEWLRVNHGIWVEVSREYTTGKYIYQYFINTNNQEFGFNSPQEAYSAAFDYILKKLI